MEEAVIADPFSFLHQHLVHQANLTGRAAKTQETDLGPDPESLVEGDDSGGTCLVLPYDISSSVYERTTSLPVFGVHGQVLKQSDRIRLGPETEIAGQAAFSLVFHELLVVQKSSNLLSLGLDAQSMPLIAMDGDFDTLPLETFAVSELEQDGVVLQSIDAEDEIIGPVPDGKSQTSGLVDSSGHGL